MKRFCLLSVLAGAVFAFNEAFAADILWENRGNLQYGYGEAPMIDALAFYNSGNLDIISLVPYDTQSTLNFTNRGTIQGSVGFTFDLGSSTEPRRPAANFINQRGGLIEAYEAVSYYASNTYYYPTFITVWATNIVNEGTLRVANAGLIRLEGENINLTRGGVEVGSLAPDYAAGVVSEGNFYPDAAVYDIAWGTGTQPASTTDPVADSSQMIRVIGGDIYAVSPLYPMTNNVYWTYSRISAYPALPFAYTNVIGGTGLTLTNQDGSTTNVFVPTNIVRQAALVGISDTNNFSVRTRFYPSSRGVDFNTVAIELRLSNTNLVTETGETNALYIVDRLASETNLVLYTNLATYPQTYKPAAQEVWRTAPYEYRLGFNGNARVDQNFVWTRSFSNRFVTNFYAGYEVYVDYLSIRPPRVAGLGVTEQPGRIEVVGNNVDLSRTRFRGMGLISVQAKHLVGSTKASVDSPSLVYSLGSTNGLLTVQNLSRESTLRMAGSLEMWSGLWTNQTAMVLSNWFIDATTNYFNPVTNTIDVGIHLLIVSADFLNATQEVVIHDFTARSTNIVIDDPLLVARSLILDGDTFTMNGKLRLTNSLANFTTTNAPHLRTFTNTGTISIPNQAIYGADAPQRYAAFVNAGTLNAFSHAIAADYYEDRGFINTSNNLTVLAGTAKLDGGRDLTRGAVSFVGDDLKMRNQTISANYGIFFSVTNNLSDTGGGANNKITVQDGFHLLRKPKQGDLLGTTFESSAAKFASVAHSWAAEDRGATKAGYQNNAAIGRLTLSVASGGELRFVKPTDELGYPREGQFALYVDALELAGGLAVDPEAYMTIDPGVTIYYAIANVPAEQLDGKFEGRLRWVREYTGPSSSTEVASYQGGGYYQTIVVNTALFNSGTIDSDGDGIPNAQDLSPFDGATLKRIQVTGKNPAQVLLSWEAAATTGYRLEAATSLVPGDWQTLATLTNAGPTTVPLSYTDLVTGFAVPGGSQRYYRVRYDP